MTVIKQYEPSRTVGNGVTTAFTLDVQVADEAEVVVNLIDTAAITNKVLQVIVTDYTVTINTTTENATITFLTPPPNTKDVILERTIDETQEFDIPDVATIRESSLEGAFDKNTKLIQQLSEMIGRQITVSVDNDTLLTYNNDLPAAVDNRALFWSVSGSVATLVNSSTDLSDIDAAVLATAADVVLTGADVVLTGADVVLTNADVVLTNADVVTTGISAAAVATIAGALQVNNVTWSCTSDDAVIIASGSVFTGVDSGNAFVFTGAKTLNKTGTARTLGALLTDTGVGNTWYYLIALGDTTGTVAPEIIAMTATEYASFTTSDLTLNYSAYDDYKRIGAVRTSSGVNWIRGEYINGTFYHEKPTVISAISSSSFVDVDTVGTVAPISRECVVLWKNTTSNDSFWRPDGVSSNGFQIYSAAGTGNSTAVTINIYLSASGIFEAKRSAGTLNANIVSYKDNLIEEGQ